MTVDIPTGNGDRDVFWQGPRIGTCGDPVDKIRIGLGRVRVIPDLVVGFDGNRNGWVIGASFRTEDGGAFEFREVAFVPEDDMDEDRFVPNRLNSGASPTSSGIYGWNFINEEMNDG